MPSHRLRLFCSVCAVVAVIVGATAPRASAAFIPIDPIDIVTVGSIFSELNCPNDDAGPTFDTACAVGLGPYDAIAGVVGPEFGGPFLPPGFNPASFGALNGVDFADMFAFHWNVAGAFAAISDTPFVTLSLFDALRQLVNDTDLVPSTITVPFLPSGNYFLLVEAFFDPPYTIQLSGPISGPTVPEPATMGLLGAGLCAAVRRRMSRR